MKGKAALPEPIQIEIWNRSAKESIGQLKKRYGISRPTVIKYMNPLHR